MTEAPNLYKTYSYQKSPEYGIMSVFAIAKKRAFQDTAIKTPYMAGAERRQNRAPREYPDELKLKELIGNTGTRLMVPRSNLFGIQEEDEYDGSKRRAVEYALDTQGINFLLENPTLACAIPEGKSLSIIIFDGHHRTRFSGGKYRINRIPTIVYTPSELAIILSHAGLQFTEEELIDYLEAGKESALASFHTLPDGKLSHVIPGITTRDELKGKFQTIEEYRTQRTNEQTLACQGIIFNTQ